MTIAYGWKRFLNCERKYMSVLVLFAQLSEMPVATASQSAASSAAEYSASAGSGDEVQGVEQQQQPESTHHDDDDVNDDANDASDTS